MPNRITLPPAKHAGDREMVQDFYGDLMITMHTSRPPSDHEWKEYVDSLRGRDLLVLRSIVFTDGGAPNSKQRKDLNEFLGDRHVNGIVISDSMAVRGVVTALSWFNPKIKAFAPREFTEALRYLNVQPNEEDAIWEVVEDLRARLTTPNLRSIPHRASL